jgi:hypothetical protein
MEQGRACPTNPSQAGSIRIKTIFSLYCPSAAWLRLTANLENAREQRRQPNQRSNPDALIGTNGHHAFDAGYYATYSSWFNLNQLVNVQAGGSDDLKLIPRL